MAYMASPYPIPTIYIYGATTFGEASIKNQDVSGDLPLAQLYNLHQSGPTALFVFPPTPRIKCVATVTTLCP